MLKPTQGHRLLVWLIPLLLDTRLDDDLCHVTQPPHQDGNCIQRRNVHPSPVQYAFPPKPPKIPLPLQIPAPPPHAPAGSPAVPGWCQHLARAIRPHTSYPGVLGGHPSPGGGQEGAHLNGLEALGACLALAGRQLISACRGRWQWLQKMVMGLGWPEAGREPLPPLPLAVAEPADPAAPGLLL